MPRIFEPEKNRQFYLDFLLPIAMEFEPEKTGPSNRAHYMRSTLHYLIEAHLLGLRARVLPLARTAVAWMAAQPHPVEGKDTDEAFRANEGWQTLGLCKWLIDVIRRWPSSAARAKPTGGSGTSSTASCQTGRSF